MRASSITPSALRLLASVLSLSVAAAGCGGEAPPPVPSSDAGPTDAGAGDLDASPSDDGGTATDASVVDDGSIADDASIPGDASMALDAGPPPTPDGGTAGRVCGGRAGSTCGADAFCDFPVPLDGTAATCGVADGMGTCTARPTNCPTEMTPVCGCDGITYRNGCRAHAAGVDEASLGACAGGGFAMCTPDDARGVGTCDAIVGFAWTGGGCVSLFGCSCEGLDCGNYASLAECISLHGTCPVRG